MLAPAPVARATAQEGHVSGRPFIERLAAPNIATINATIALLSGSSSRFRSGHLAARRTKFFIADMSPLGSVVIERAATATRVLNQRQSNPSGSAFKHPTAGAASASSVEKERQGMVKMDTQLDEGPVSITWPDALSKDS